MARGREREDGEGCVRHAVRAAADNGTPCGGRPPRTTSSSTADDITHTHIHTHSSSSSNGKTHARRYRLRSVAAAAVDENHVERKRMIKKSLAHTHARTHTRPLEHSHTRARRGRVCVISYWQCCSGNTCARVCVCVVSERETRILFRCARARRNRERDTW